MKNNTDVYLFDLIFDLKICIRYTDMELKGRRAVTHMAASFCASLFLLRVLLRGPFHSHLIFHGLGFSEINPIDFSVAGIK